MVVYKELNNISILGKSVLTMGTFDGIHRGHQDIIQRVVHHARALQIPSVLVTYHPHPRYVIGKQDQPRLLMSLDRKLQHFETFGLDYVLVVPFDHNIAKMSAVDYVESIICHYFHPIHVVIGYDHHFGRERKGSPELLQSLSPGYGFTVDIVRAVSDEGNVISSTRIRELIRDGYVRRASFELGRVYGFEAKVVHGAGRGRTLEFPTANFICLEKHQLLPKQGVYCTRGRVNGQLLYGMCNLGVRPTFGENEFVMEVHFLNKPLRNLYGKTIEIDFLERIRDEKKFSSRDALVKQLQKDKTMCLEIIKKYM